MRLGETLLDGLPAERRRVGLLFQDPLLFPHLSVGGNLAFGMAPGGRRRERRARVAEALAQAGLAGYADRDPATLSGGQKARVALLRVLLSEPRAMLLDEPFSSLDVALRNGLRRQVVAEIARRGLPALLVTHDPADAEAAGGRVITLGGT
nr:ATP-binding cassette domain-containing protein [Modicisalibacter tunisiensis]